jgi:hypothetical protein
MDRGPLSLQAPSLWHFVCRGVAAVEGPTNVQKEKNFQPQNLLTMDKTTAGLYRLVGIQKPR